MAARDGLLRERGGADAGVTPIELFFDLVYVLAVTQLTHQLLTHLTLRGAAVETLLLLIAVWTAWMYTAWVTSWFDPSTLPVRLMLVGVMLGSLLMSAAIPRHSATGGSSSRAPSSPSRSVGPSGCSQWSGAATS